MKHNPFINHMMSVRAEINFFSFLKREEVVIKALWQSLSTYNKHEGPLARRLRLIAMIDKLTAEEYPQFSQTDRYREQIKQPKEEELVW